MQNALYHKPPRGSVVDPFHPLSRGLVGCWLFNEGQDSKVSDLTGRGNDGTLTNMDPTTDWQMGQYAGDWALTQDGDQAEAITVSDDPILTCASAITVEAWIKVVGYPLAGKLAAIVKKRRGASVSYQFLVDENGRLACGSGPTNTSTATAMGIGTWRHVIGVWDGANIQMYLDGVADGAAKAKTGTMADTADDLVFGFVGLTAYFYALDGQFSLIRLWDRGLLAAEVGQLYQQPYCNIITPQPRPWVFEEAAVGVPTIMDYYPETEGSVMILLRQSTARTLLVGPFLDSADGSTAETGLTITQAEVRLSKNGGNMAQKHEATSLTHDELGYYTCPVDTDDTDTLGILSLMIHESGALPVWQDYMVVPANVWDSLFSTDKLQVDLLQMGGVAQSATDLKDFADAGYDPETDKVNGVKLVDTTTENTDMVGTDGAATPGAEMDLVEAPNATAIAAIVDGLALEATLTALKGAGWSDETLVAIKAVLDTAAADVVNIDGAAMVGTNGAALASAWTAARAVFIDKLNVAGTLAHSDAAATYKADVSNLDEKVSTRSSHTAAAVWDVATRTLSTDGIKAIWDQLTAALTTAGSIGKLLVDRLTPGSLVVFSPEFTGNAGLSYGELKATFDQIAKRTFGADQRFVTPNLRAQWLNLGYQQVCRELHWPCGTYEITTEEDEATYATLTALRVWEFVQYTDEAGNQDELQQISIRELIEKRSGGSASGTPSHYMRHGETLQLWPTPDTAEETVTVWAVMEPDNLSEDADKPGFAADLHELIVRLAIASALELFGREEEALTHRLLVDAALSRAKKKPEINRGQVARVENRGV